MNSSRPRSSAWPLAAFEVERLAADQPAAAHRFGQQVDQVLAGVALEPQLVHPFGENRVGAVEQPVRRQHRHRLAVDPVGGGAAAAQLGVVHHRQVVEHQRAGVHHLDRAGEVEGLRPPRRRTSRPPPARSTGRSRLPGLAAA